MILDMGNIHLGHSILRQSTDLISVKEALPSFPEKIECSLTIDRTTTEMFIQVHFSGVFEQVCARCLKTFLQPVTGDIRLVLLEVDGKSGVAEENDVADYYYNSQDFLVDISGALFDEIMISLPLKPLCAESCTGIVFNQHKMENTESEDVGDPRWDALREFKKKITKQL